jgi:hypothetical protein
MIKSYFCINQFYKKTVNHKNSILSEEIACIIRCLSHNNKAFYFSDSLDWELFKTIARELRIAPILYYAICKQNLQKSIPDDVLQLLESHYYKTLQKNTVLYHHLSQLLIRFNKENITVVGLKGIFLAETVYEDIALRQLSDIDILIKKKDVSKCTEILTAMGFEFDTSFVKSDFITDMRDGKHLPMLVKQGVGVELHTHLIGKDNACTISTQDFWNSTRPGNLSGLPVLHFHPHYLLLHIILHADEHFASAKIHFIGYIDIARIIETYKKEINWNVFTELCDSYSCSNQVFIHLYLAAKYIGIDIPQEIFKKASQYCDSYQEEFFVHHIMCDTSFVPKKKNRNISELQTISGFRNKIRYLLDDMFPSKTFMLNRYKIKNPKMYMFYYPRRLFEGIVSLVKYVLHIGRI